jgi:hypothetical protein
MPQDLGLPVQAGAGPPSATLDANTESFFVSLVEAQCGHRVPCQSEDRTSSSLSFPHFPQ